MRGKNRRQKNYFDRNRNNIDEWVNPGQKSNYRGRNARKFSRREDNYQYIQKEIKRYSKNELINLAPEFKIGQDVLEDLCKDFDDLFTKEKREPLDLDIEDDEDTFIYNAERPKKFNGYPRGGRTRGGYGQEYGYRKDSYNDSDKDKKVLKKFDNFMGEELPEGFFENTDKLLEQKYYASKKEDDHLPAWATEDYDEDIPVWGDVDTTEVIKDTQNANKWSENFIKTIDKEEIGKENLDEDGQPLEGTQKVFTQEDINNLPNLLQMMQEEEATEVEPEREEPVDLMGQLQSQPESGGEKAFNNLLSLFAGSDDVRVIGGDSDKEEQQSSEEEENPGLMPSNGSKYTDMFSRVKTGSQFGNFAGLNAFIQNDDEDEENEEEDEDDDEDEDIAITDMITGPPPPVVPKDEPEEDDFEKEQSKREFQEKYFVMDKVLSQVVYDALNSKRRRAINLHSVNGINQMSAEKFCANNYKIFSFLMQGDIFSKVWFYKDKLGNVQGPFMSFDMDIWNGEGNYFAKSLQISPNNKDYHSLRKYINRDPLVIELMQETVTKQEQKLENPMMMRMMIPPRNQQQLNPFGFLPPNQYGKQQVPMMKMPPNQKNKMPKMQKMKGGRPPYNVQYMVNPANIQQFNAQMHKKGRVLPPKMAPVYMYSPQMMAAMSKNQANQKPPSSPLLPQGAQQQPHVIMNLNNLGTAANEQTQNLKDLLGIGLQGAGVNPLEGLLGPGPLNMNDNQQQRPQVIRTNVLPMPQQPLKGFSGEEFPSLGEALRKR